MTIDRLPPSQPEPGDDLWPRHAPGEELGPLLWALAGGLMGGVAALAVDWLISRAAGTPWLWPSVTAQTLASQPSQFVTGVVLALTIAIAASLVFVFGQFRRFVPGQPVVAGAVWGIVLWLLVAPWGLPRWTTLDLAADGAEAILGLAFIAVAQSLVTMLTYGCVVGWLNPRRDHDSAED